MNPHSVTLSDSILYFGSHLVSKTKQNSELQKFAGKRKVLSENNFFSVPDSFMVFGTARGLGGDYTKTAKVK
jgi:hypothetical protein